MKKILTLIFIHVSVIGFSQVSYGVKAGANLSSLAYKTNMEGFTWDNIKPVIGFHAGVYFQIPLNKRFSFAPELQFTNRGYKQESFFSMPETRHVLSYLELPVLVSYSPVKWLGIDLGANVGYLIGAVAKSDDDKNDVDNLYDKKWDVALNAGFRIHTSEKIAVVFRYHYGFTSIIDVSFRDENNMSYGDVRYFNRSAQLGICYKLK